MINRIHFYQKAFRSELRSFFWYMRWRRKKKCISGLIRVRNGEEFLRPSAESIIGVLDELVIVNNFSTDGTSEIIEELKLSYPGKVHAFRYDHDVASLGEDSFKLNSEDPSSPRLPHNYSNWCAAQCKFPYILKWDDDMIATPSLVKEIEDFKQSRYLHFKFGGHNISPDLNHVLTWKAGIEPRIFPFTTQFRMEDYGGVIGPWCSAKYMGEGAAVWVSARYTLRSERNLYAHMKYCKKNPGSNQSPEFRKDLESAIKSGDEIPEEIKLTLQSYLPKSFPR